MPVRIIISEPEGGRVQRHPHIVVGWGEAAMAVLGFTDAGVNG